MDQVRRIDQLSLSELFAIKNAEGDDTPEAVLAAIEERQVQQAQATNKPVPAPQL